MSASPPFTRIIYSWIQADTRGFRRYECHGDHDGRWEAMTFSALRGSHSQRAQWGFQLEEEEAQEIFEQAADLASDFLSSSASHRWIEQASRENESIWLLHDQGVFAIPGSRPEARRFLALLEQWPWSQGEPHQFFARLRLERGTSGRQPLLKNIVERTRSAPTQQIDEEREPEAAPLLSVAAGDAGAKENGETAELEAPSSEGVAVATRQRWIERSGFIRRGTKSWQTAIRGTGLFEGAVIEAETVVFESQQPLNPELVREAFSKLDKLFQALKRFDAGEIAAPSGQSQAQWYAFHGFWEGPRYFSQSSPEFQQIAALLAPLTNNSPAVQSFFTKI